MTTTTTTEANQTGQATTSRKPRTTQRAPKPGVTNTQPAAKTAPAKPAKATPAAKAPEPAPEPKVLKSDAKTDLGRRAVLALDAMFASLDPSDAALAGWTKDEAAQCLANWVHHFPTGKANGKRDWPATTLAKPQRSDWA
jgi:hypothetical protein